MCAVALLAIVGSIIADDRKDYHHHRDKNNKEGKTWRKKPVLGELNESPVAGIREDETADVEDDAQLRKVGSEKNCCIVLVDVRIVGR